MKTALIAGSTGLVGSALLKLLADSPDYDKIIRVTRRPLPPVRKVIDVIADADTLNESGSLLKADDIFCTLGTTIKAAGSKEIFRKVDFDYPFMLAGICKMNGAQQFLIVTASGANPDSMFFYNRIKGEVEDALKKIGYRTMHIFRPSLLLGERKESRPAEEAAKKVFKALSFLIPDKVKGIEASRVAQGMLREANKNVEGVYIHPSDKI
jgi:uncharacterized protein YbjT (DUF2867 family)